MPRSKKTSQPKGIIPSQEGTPNPQILPQETELNSPPSPSSESSDKLSNKLDSFLDVLQDMFAAQFQLQQQQQQLQQQQSTNMLAIVTQILQQQQQQPQQPEIKIKAEPFPFVKREGSATSMFLSNNDKDPYVSPFKTLPSTPATISSSLSKDQQDIKSMSSHFNAAFPLL
jgi:hypothetical protein